MGGLPGALATAPDQTRPQRRCHHHRRAAGGGTGLARTAGGYRRAVYSLSPGWRRRLANCHWPWTFSLGCTRARQIKPGLSVAAVVFGVQRGCGPGLARIAGGSPDASCSWRVWCRGTGLRPCVFQLGCRRCGRSPASRGLAGLGVTGLSAARLRAGTTVDAILAVPAVTLSGPDRAREPRWAAPDQTHSPHPASGPLTSGRRSANGPPRAGASGHLDTDSDAGPGRIGPLGDDSGHGSGPCPRGSVPVRCQPCYGPSSFPLIPKHRCKLLQPPPRPV
jgi:hypothetical protein